MASHSLLQWGIGIFVCGLAIRLAGGEPWSAVALGVQILGALLLFVNAARSRERALHGAPAISRSLDGGDPSQAADGRRLEDPGSSSPDESGRR